MQFSAILGRFSEVSPQSDGGYLAVCPAHDDSDPSLRIWCGDNGKVRITCRAGCSTEEVINAVGLSFASLFGAETDGLVVPKDAPEPASLTAVAALAAYVDRRTTALFNPDYSDAVSALEYAARRFGIDRSTALDLGLGVDSGGPDEAFMHRSRTFTRYPRLIVPLNDFKGVPRGLQGRDITGKCAARWVSLSNPPGQRWAPYGVFRGHGGFNVYVVCEGPGDALSTCALGYDSVAIRGASLGASADVIRELAAGFTGADRVIIVGDSDNAGQTFARTLSEGLRGHGIAAHTLALPAGVKDVTAWRERAPEAFSAEFHAAVGYAQLAESWQSSRKRQAVNRTGAELVSSAEGESAAAILSSLMDTYGESDAMNAYALVAWADGCIRYAPGLGFYVWNGKVWHPSTTKVRQTIHKMGAALVLAGKLHESKGFTMTTRIDALMTELQSVPSVLVSVDEFDSHAHLLNFDNGTVDLRTGMLRPHSKEDLLTCSLDFDYDPRAQCPRWEAFLAEIFPTEPELVGYMQRLSGYGITGSTDEQCFAVLYGKGANGKSVFTDTLSSVFGAITRTTRFATFERRATGNIPNDIAALRGARLVMSSEGGADKQMDEEGLKSLTGKDRVQARFLNKEFFTYRPTFLIMLATNHKPNFRSQDEGLWRRVKMIPFSRFFSLSERDYDLDRKLMKERAGIAAWAVRGAVEWYREGLKDPDCIRGATREFRETSDTMSGFYPGVIVDAPNERINGAQAYLEYKTWCDDEGLSGREVLTRTRFYRMMEERGVTKRKMTEGIVLEGVKLSTVNKVTGPGIFGHA